MAIQRRGLANPLDTPLWGWLFWAAFFAAGGYGVYWCIGALKDRADSEVDRNAPVSSAKYKKNVAGAGSRQAPPNYVPRNSKPEIDRAAAEVNLLVLSKEAARLREDTGQQMEFARSLTGARQRFQQASEGELGANLPELLEGNDEILGLDDYDFSKMKPTEAASRITRSIAQIPPGTFLRVHVRRGYEREVTLYFGAASGTGAVLAQHGYIKITTSFAQEIQKHVLSLPPEQLVEAERVRIEKILGAGECSEDDYTMLSEKVNGSKISSGQATARAESFTRQIERLRAFLPKAPVPEAILLKDGRRFSGKLLQDTPGAVAVRTVVGDITVAKDDVERLITADDLRAEFQSKFGAGEKYRDALLQLLLWCQEMGMPVHRELVAYTILQTTPSEAFARNAAGYVQMDGQWVLRNSIAAGAPIPERKAETREDIRRELESMGFVLRGNKWYSKVPWSTGIDTLWRPGAIKSNLNGTAVMDWHEGDTLFYRMDDKRKPLGPVDLKFIAPTGQQGLASIAIDAGGELVECQVRACGGLIDEKPGARIECFLTAEGGRSEVLYDISKGSDMAFHDVTAYVRGKQRFTVTARILTVQDKYHAYARWLLSNKDTLQVFWVKGVVLKSAFEFDRVWANAK
jgi:hypothetical protein